MRMIRVIQIRLVAVALGIAVVLTPAISQVSTVPLDLVVVLDNSGSMKQNDPKFLMPQVVSTFAARLAPDARLGIIVFDKTVNVVLGLTAADAPDFAQRVSEGLKRVNYRGPLTDIPAGIERAVYELRAHGRPEAQRLVAFLTDGMVDVGSPAQNLERARWLREHLALEAKRLGIRLFGIALTEAADFQLVQSVAQTTGGAYFRILTDADISATFEQIRSQIAEMTRTTPQTTKEVTPENASVPVIPAPTVDGSRIVDPPPIPITDWRPWLFGGLGVVAVVTILAVMALRSSRQSKPKIVVPAATLYDRSGHSAAQKYAINKPVTRIGRDTKLNDVVIPHDTVSSQHADIEYRDGVFHLRDLLSTNGTFVNGKKFSDTEQICEVALKNRDRLRFDAYEFEFVVDALENAEQTKLPGPEPVRRTRLRPEPHDGQNGAQEVVSPQPVEGVANAPANGEERPTKLKGDMCQQHPSIKVTERCEGCGRECCKLCVIEQDGRILCRAICAAQLT